VALNADSPIQYPPRLYDQKVEGDVVLRLFVDSAGRLLPESSKVAESSGYSALDSAALSGARKLRFAPARRHGLAIAAAFLQPVEFRHPQAGGAVLKGEPDTAKPSPPRVPPPAASPPSLPAARTAAPPVQTPRRDTTVIKRDTTPRPLDTTRTAPDTAGTKPDSNVVPH
jgi:TonB family protein